MVSDLTTLFLLVSVFELPRTKWYSPINRLTKIKQTKKITNTLAMSSILHRFSRVPSAFLLITSMAVFLAVLTFNLSLWQFERADKKRQWEDRAAAGLAAAVTDLPTAGQPVEVYQRVRAVGQYLPDNTLLLDNRVQNKLAGFEVVTPLALADGRVLVVKRGWLAHGGNRQLTPLPPPDGVVTVTGALYHDNSAAFTLSDEEVGVIRQRIILQEFADKLAVAVVPLLLVQENSEKGLAPAVLPVDFKSARSTVYAWQWLSLCLLVVCLYLFWLFKR